MNPVRMFWRRLFRFVVVWLVDAVSLLVTAWLVPGITLSGADLSERLAVATSAALVLGIVNLIFRPIILLFSRALGYIVVLIMGFLVNAVVLLVTAWLMPGFEVNGILPAIVGGLIFAIVNTLVTSVISLDEEDSFYRRRILSRAAKTPYPDAQSGTTGLAMIEIDGLSYWHIQKALAEGWMPNLKEWIDQDGYVLTRTDCGLPSQTSACQAGIMFGDNYDIPAFRWYDKTQQRLIVSGKDAAELNARYADGEGLMREGTSINNMLNGDARKSIMTVSDIKTGTDEQNKARAEDIFLLMLDPYFFMRSLVLFFVDAGRDLWEGWQQKRHDVYPRLNRREHFYPFVRAAMVTLMREISSNLVILDVVRGSPSIYMTYPGYDEVAHHSGPWTTDAFKVLKKFDHTLAQIRHAIETQAPRPYDLVVLSDHGQSFGPTFLMRYGKDIKTTIQDFMPAGKMVAASMGGDTGVNSMSALGNEMANVGSQGVGNAAGRAVAKQTQKLTDRAVAEQSPEEVVTAEGGRKAEVMAYGSGNIAQVYFTEFPQKMNRADVEAAFPRLVEKLVAHEGVGFVLYNNTDGTATVVGKQGIHNVHTGAVTGIDPLLPYAKEGVATTELRAEQLRRIADFPHAGDLMVNSTVYDDGTVAALEELIGCHGGLGGEQTDAFILHPGTWTVPATKNSADVFHVLNAQRGTAPKPTPTAVREQAAGGVNGWAPAAMGRGLSQVGLWVSRAGRCLLLDVNAYHQVGKDPLMNAPALLIGAFFAIVTSAAWSRQFDLGIMVGAVVTWLISVAIVFGAARALKGKGDFSATLRVMGFAQTAEILNLLVLLPVMGSIAPLAAILLNFLGTWIGAAQAHELKGWRSLLLPVIAVVVFVGASVILTVLGDGLQLTIDTFLQSLGMSQG